MPKLRTGCGGAHGVLKAYPAHPCAPPPSNESSMALNIGGGAPRCASLWRDMVGKPISKLDTMPGSGASSWRTASVMEAPRFPHACVRTRTSRTAWPECATRLFNFKGSEHGRPIQPRPRPHGHADVAHRQCGDANPAAKTGCRPCRNGRICRPTVRRRPVAPIAGSGPCRPCSSLRCSSAGHHAGHGGRLPRKEARKKHRCNPLQERAHRHATVVASQGRFATPHRGGARPDIIFQAALDPERGNAWPRHARSGWAVASSEAR
jgi:hypothetical protein